MSGIRIKERNQTHAWPAQPSLLTTDLQFGVPSQEGCDAVGTFGVVAGFGVHDPVHHPAGVEHIDHKHPHDQGGERCFQKHDARVVSSSPSANWAAGPYVCKWGIAFDLSMKLKTQLILNAN